LDWRQSFVWLIDVHSRDSVSGGRGKRVRLAPVGLVEWVRHRRFSGRSGARARSLGGYGLGLVCRGSRRWLRSRGGAAYCGNCSLGSRCGLAGASSRDGDVGELIREFGGRRL
jgi:hypothetical protein